MGIGEIQMFFIELPIELPIVLPIAPGRVAIGTYCPSVFPTLCSDSVLPDGQE